MASVETLITGLVVGESPRWHDGRLWFCNWGAQEIRTLDPAGTSETVARGPKPVGFCIDFLPDGRLLVTGEDRLLRREADGSFVTHADLSALGRGWNEITVDGRGNIYVNRVGFNFGQEEFRPGTIAVVTPDGAARQVADNVMFPNGMVITPDNSTLVIAESWAHRLTAFDIEPDGSLTNRRVWAEVDGDGICLDAEGAIWCSGVSGGQPVCLRVREGGEVLERIAHDAACFACMLGGEGGRTLYMMNAEWRGVERMGELFQSRTGKVETVRVEVPHAGRP
ncbi:MAG TPA: SMP-30/gluconolactonase/LRE family protein [Candidatus Dormibacteraeota bacterium]|nr:SMP-30/gluconolactonase/LRE family protein [Candidatus Dormibacteraeota bacterium]